MLLTEKEARIKVCPVQRSAHGQFCQCFASECAAWRDSGQKNDNDEPLGYCGLAGKPVGFP
jgi:hypothetical protein